MEHVWHYLGLYLGLEFVDLCSGYPLASSTLAGGASPQEAAWVSLSPLVSAVLLASSVLLVFGCLCCRRTKGFQQNERTIIKEFTDSGSTPNLSTPGDVGYVNNAASPEFPLFPPPQQPANQSVRFEPLPEIVPPNRTKKPAAFNNAVSHGLSEQDWFASEGPSVDFPRQQLQYVREAGRGWFGRVVEGNAQHIVSTATTTPVVVKILRDDAGPTDQMYFLHEVRAYRDLTHPNVLRMLGRCLEADPFLVLLEACPTGDLKSFLCQNISTARALSDEGVTLNMGCNIAAGLEHMLDNGFVHTDLAARNCLVTPDLTVKIGDYGHSIESFKEDYYLAGDVALPVRWCAPETVYCTDTTIQTKEVTPAANVWNLGVVLWEIAEFGKLPYEDLTDDEVVGQVFGESKKRLPLPSLPAPHRDNLYLLMKLCWSSVEDRPALTQVHSMLKHLNASSHRHPLDGPDSSLRTEGDFNRRWESFKPNTIAVRDDHALSETPEAPGSPLRLALDPDIGQPASSQKNLDAITPCATSPQLSVASSFGAEFSRTRDRSASLQNLRGSLDDVSDSIQGRWEGKGAVKSEEGSTPDFESWLRGVETTDEEEAKFVAKISEAIRDLDDALALEKTSSSSSSSSAASSARPSPARQARHPEQNGVLDFRLGGRHSNSSEDTEDETWRYRVSERVREKSRSVADLMVLTHVDPADCCSDSEPPSLTWSHYNNNNNRSSEGDVRGAVAGEEFLESLHRIHSARRDSNRNILSEVADFLEREKKHQDAIHVDFPPTNHNRESDFLVFDASGKPQLNVKESSPDTLPDTGTGEESITNVVDELIAPELNKERATPEPITGRELVNVYPPILPETITSRVLAESTPQYAAGIESVTSASIDDVVRSSLATGNVRAEFDSPVPEMRPDERLPTEDVGCVDNGSERPCEDASGTAKAEAPRPELFARKPVPLPRRQARPVGFATSTPFAHRVAHETPPFPSDLGWDSPNLSSDRTLDETVPDSADVETREVSSTTQHFDEAGSEQTEECQLNIGRQVPDLHQRPPAFISQEHLSNYVCTSPSERSSEIIEALSGDTQMSSAFLSRDHLSSSVLSSEDTTSPSERSCERIQAATMPDPLQESIVLIGDSEHLSSSVLSSEDTTSPSERSSKTNQAATMPDPLQESIVLSGDSEHLSSSVLSSEDTTSPSERSSETNQAATMPDPLQESIVLSGDSEHLSSSVLSSEDTTSPSERSRETNQAATMPDPLQESIVLSGDSEHLSSSVLSSEDTTSPSERSSETNQAATMPDPLQESIVLSGDSEHLSSSVLSSEDTTSPSERSSETNQAATMPDPLQESIVLIGDSEHLSSSVLSSEDTTSPSERSSEIIQAATMPDPLQESIVLSGDGEHLSSFVLSSEDTTSPSERSSEIIQAATMPDPLQESIVLGGDSEHLSISSEDTTSPSERSSEIIQAATMPDPLQESIVLRGDSEHLSSSVLSSEDTTSPSERSSEIIQAATMSDPLQESIVLSGDSEHLSISSEDTTSPSECSSEIIQAATMPDPLQEPIVLGGDSEHLSSSVLSSEDTTSPSERSSEIIVAATIPTPLQGSIVLSGDTEMYPASVSREPLSNYVLSSEDTTSPSEHSSKVIEAATFTIPDPLQGLLVLGGDTEMSPAFHSREHLSNSVLSSEDTTSPSERSGGIIEEVTFTIPDPLQGSTLLGGDTEMSPTFLSREHFCNNISPIHNDTRQSEHSHKHNEADAAPGALEVCIPVQINHGVNLSPVRTSKEHFSNTTSPSHNTTRHSKHSHENREGTLGHSRVVSVHTESEPIPTSCLENVSTALDMVPIYLSNGFEVMVYNDEYRNISGEFTTSLESANVVNTPQPSFPSLETSKLSHSSPLINTCDVKEIKPGEKPLPIDTRVLPENPADSLFSIDILKSESNLSTNFELSKLPKEEEALVEFYNGTSEPKSMPMMNDAISNAFKEVPRPTEKENHYSNTDDILLSDRLVFTNASSTIGEDFSLSVSGDKDQTGDALSSVILGPCEDFTMEYFKGLKTTFPDAGDRTQQAFRLQFDPRETGYVAHGALVRGDKSGVAHIDYSINGWDNFLGKTLEGQDTSQYDDVTFPSLAMDHHASPVFAEDVFESIGEIGHKSEAPAVSNDEPSEEGDGVDAETCPGSRDDLSRLESVANRLREGSVDARELCDVCPVGGIKTGDTSEEDCCELKRLTPDDERSSDSGFRDKGSLSESCEDACDERYNLEDIEAELEETFARAEEASRGAETSELAFPTCDDLLDSNSTSVHKPRPHDLGRYLEASQISNESTSLDERRDRKVETSSPHIDDSNVIIESAQVVTDTSCESTKTFGHSGDGNFAERFVTECIDFGDDDARGETVSAPTSPAKRGGWYLHPRETDDVAAPKSEGSTPSKHDDSENSYVSYHLDEEYAAAIRNELREKLPCANQGPDSDSEEDMTDEEEGGGDRQDMMIHYNMYPAPLSPILEERESMSSLDYSPYTLDSEPDSLVFSLDSQEEVRRASDARRFEEDIREALENASLESSSSSDREPNTTVLLVDLDPNAGEKAVRVRGSTRVAEEDVLVVDTETNVARLVESPIPRLQLAFVSKRSADRTPVVATPDFLKEEGESTVNSETFVKSRFEPSAIESCETSPESSVNTGTFVIDESRFEQSGIKSCEASPESSGSLGRASAENRRNVVLDIDLERSVEQDVDDLTPDSFSPITVPTTSTDTEDVSEFYLTPPSHVAVDSAVRDISLNFANNEAAEIVSDLRESGIVATSPSHEDIVRLMTGEIYDDSTESSDDKYSPRSLEDDFEEMISLEEYSQSSGSREYDAPTPESQMSLECVRQEAMSPVRRLDFLTASVGLATQSDAGDFDEELDRTLRLEDLGSLLRLNSEASLRDAKSMPSPSVNTSAREIIVSFVKSNEQNLALLSKKNLQEESSRVEPSQFNGDVNNVELSNKQHLALTVNNLQEEVAKPTLVELSRLNGQVNNVDSSNKQNVAVLTKNNLQEETGIPTDKLSRLNGDINNVELPNKQNVAVLTTNNFKDETGKPTLVELSRLNGDVNNVELSNKQNVELLNTNNFKDETGKPTLVELSRLNGDVNNVDLSNKQNVPLLTINNLPEETGKPTHVELSQTNSNISNSELSNKQNIVVLPKNNLQEETTKPTHGDLSRLNGKVNNSESSNEDKLNHVDKFNLITITNKNNVLSSESFSSKCNLEPRQILSSHVLTNGPEIHYDQHQTEEKHVGTISGEGLHEHTVVHNSDKSSLVDENEVCGALVGTESGRHLASDFIEDIVSKRTDETGTIVNTDIGKENVSDSKTDSDCSHVISSVSQDEASVVHQTVKPEGCELEGRASVKNASPVRNASPEDSSIPEGCKVEASAGAKNASPEDSSVPESCEVEASAGAKNASPEDSSVPESCEVEASAGAKNASPEDSSVPEGCEVEARAGAQATSSEDSSVPEGCEVEGSAGAQAASPDGCEVEASAGAQATIPKGCEVEPSAGAQAASLKRCEVEASAGAQAASPEDCSVQTLAKQVVFLEAPKQKASKRPVDPQDITLDLHVLESNLEDWSRFLGSRAPMPSPEEESWRLMSSARIAPSSMLGFSEAASPPAVDTPPYGDEAGYGGLGLSDEMSTSFSAPGGEDEEEDYAPDWESDSECSSSSGEFVWRDGDKDREASVRDLLPQAHTNTRYMSTKPYECLPEFPMEVIAEEDEDEDDEDDDDDEDDSSVGSGTEFVPSAWDSQATPSRSALRSPDKKADGKKNVWFKKQKYHCVYEYPRENSDTEGETSEPTVADLHPWRPHAGTTPAQNWQPPPAVDYASYADWEVAEGDGDELETETESDNNNSNNDQEAARAKAEPFDFYKLSNVDYDFSTGVISEDGEFFISSSARPFQQFNATPNNLFGSSEFFPGQSLDQLVAGPGPTDQADEIDTSPRNIAGSKKAELPGEGDSPPSPLSPTGLGELRHTRDRLKLHLPPPSPDAPAKWAPSFVLEAPGKRGGDSGEDTEDSGIESSNGMSATLTLKTSLEESLLADAH